MEKRAEVVQKTTLTEDVDASRKVFRVDDVLSLKDPDYLRVGDEYVKVVSVSSGTREILVEREQIFGETGGRATFHPGGSVIYCLSELAIGNLYQYKLNPRKRMDGPQMRIDNTKNEDLIPALAGTQYEIVELPVLFKTDTGLWFPYTANPVNCLIAGGTVFVADPDGPTAGGTDHFQAMITDRMKTVGSCVFIDAWELHKNGGHVHCGTNTKREPHQAGDPPSPVEWWTAWQE